MSAIAGIFSPTLPLPSWKEEEILSTMKRRGPDEWGFFNNENISMVYTGLAVTTRNARHQPCRFGLYTLIYDGQIYNSEDLRSSLTGLGWELESESDGELLLKAYLQWGEGFLDRINGTFALAIYDRGDNALFLARDPMGGKPLFYTTQGGSYCFASEIKTLFHFPEVKPELDTRGVAELLLLGPGRISGSGVFRGINELKPGYYARFDDQGCYQKQYYQLRDKICRDDLQTAAEKVRFLVENAVKRQLICDAPLGTFLSGGLDSSIVSTIVAKETGNIRTYSVEYDRNDEYYRPTKFQPNSDTAYMSLMEQKLQSDPHHIRITTDALVKALSEATEARDLPGMADVDSAMLLLCKETSQTAKVILSGECADEIFGGYPWFRDNSSVASGFPWARNTSYRASFLKKGLRDAINPEQFVHQQYQAAVSQAHILPENSEEDRHIKVLTVLNMNCFMQTLMDRNDRMSQWSGLEVRAPFCDREIVEYLYTLPWSIKNYGGREKGLLRYAFRDLLPEEVIYRKKSPFPKTWDPAYKAAVSELLREELSSSSPLLEFLDRDALLALCDTEEPNPWYGQLMTTPQTIAYFLQMAHWIRHYHISLV